MKNAFFLACILLIQVAVKAQMKIGDNPTNINSASLLELETTNKGLVFPRISLTNVSLPAPLPAGLLTGTVLFNTNASITGGNGVGLYVWSGTVWTPVISTAGLPAWNLTGNTGTSYTSNFIGTIDNVGFRVRTNNIQRLLVDSLGDVAIGSTAFNPNNRQRLLVDYGTTTSHTVANFRGNIDGYFQINLQNTSSGVNASSDYVATADDGTDSTFYVDMGINSSTFAPGVENWGNRHDAYLYSNSRNLLIGTQAAPSDLIFLSGGGKIKDNAVMRITGPSGNIVIGKGELTDNPQGNIIRGPNGSGTNIAGGSLTLNGGAGTGTANGGSLNLFAGTTAAGLQGDVNIQGKNVKAKLRKGGSFIILNDSTPGNELVKLLIKETGEVNWYLDGQDLFIRDGSFLAFPDSPLYKYDFMHIDGANGRIGFNVLNGHSDGSPGGVNSLPLTSSLSLFGSVAYRVRTINFSTGSPTYNVKQDDNILMLNKADNSKNYIYMSPAAGSKGRMYTLKRDATKDGDIYVRPQTGEKLNGIVDKEIKLDKENSSLQLVCDGTGWWILSEVSTSAPSEFSITTNTTTSLTSENFINVNFTSLNQIIDLNLPAAADYEGQRYEIKRNADGTIFSGNVLRIVPASGENLDQSTFASPYLMENDFESVTVQSNGTRWLILNNYNAENAIREVSTTSTISTSDRTLLIPSTSTIALTLPDITTVPVGKIITVKRTAGAGTGVITLLKSGVAVEGAASLTIDGTTLSTVTVQSDGLAWWVISKF